jgi:hypothetical protein
VRGLLRRGRLALEGLRALRAGAAPIRRAGGAGRGPALPVLRGRGARRGGRSAALLGLRRRDAAGRRGAGRAGSPLFYPIYRGAGVSLASIEDQADGGVVSWLTLMPAAVVLGFFWNRFAAAEEGIGRARELAADRVGAEVAGAAVVAAALVKLYAFERCWSNVRGLMRGAIVRGQAIPNVGPAFAEAAQRAAVPSTLVGLDRQRLPHPTDSHPPLSQRLRALGVALEDVAAAAPARPPARSALSLLPRRRADRAGADRRAAGGRDPLSAPGSIRARQATRPR